MGVLIYQGVIWPCLTEMMFEEWRSMYSGRPCVTNMVTIIKLSVIKTPQISNFKFFFKWKIEVLNIWYKWYVNQSHTVACFNIQNNYNFVAWMTSIKPIVLTSTEVRIKLITSNLLWTAINFLKIMLKICFGCLWTWWWYQLSFL